MRCLKGTCCTRRVGQSQPTEKGDSQWQNSALAFGTARRIKGGSMRELLGTGGAFLNLVGSIVLAIDAQAAVRRARVKKAATDLAGLLRQNATTDLVKDDTGNPINDEAAIELWLS